LVLCPAASGAFFEASLAAVGQLPFLEAPLLAQEPVDMWALSKFFAGVKSGLRRQTPKIIVAAD
jgi:hypothetical protein